MSSTTPLSPNEQLDNRHCSNKQQQGPAVINKQPEEKKKYHGTIRDMMASSICFLITKEDTSRLCSAGLIFVSVRTNKRHHHHE
jgi:hypothetical protein